MSSPLGRERRAVPAETRSSSPGASRDPFPTPGWGSSTPRSSAPPPADHPTRTADLVDAPETTQADARPGSPRATPGASQIWALRGVLPLDGAMHPTRGLARVIGRFRGPGGPRSGSGSRGVGPRSPPPSPTGPVRFGASPRVGESGTPLEARRSPVALTSPYPKRKGLGSSWFLGVRFLPLSGAEIQILDARAGATCDTGRRRHTGKNFARNLNTGKNTGESTGLQKPRHSKALL